MSGLVSVDPAVPAAQRWLERGLALVLIAIVLLNVGNMLARTAFGTGLLWADEVQVYLFIWIGFLGAALVTWQRSHLRIGLLRTCWPAGVQRKLEGVEAALVPVLCCFVAWQSCAYVWRIARVGTRSDMAGLPMWLPHAAVASGLVLIASLEVIHTVRRRKRGA
jgi:TRAP-type C4-dicarboxylate transport system permease small subunit